MSNDPSNPPPKRYGLVLGVRPEKIAEYKRLHAEVWPGVLALISECHIGNYSIFLRETDPGRFHLFAYFEYRGTDFKADMAMMAASPEMRRWWDVCEPCQSPVPTALEGDWWAQMEEVFHLD
jgi:L-rhamnose mutarotase